MPTLYPFLTVSLAKSYPFLGILAKRPPIKILFNANPEPSSIPKYSFIKPLPTTIAMPIPNIKISFTSQFDNFVVVIISLHKKLKHNILKYIIT